MERIPKDTLLLITGYAGYIEYKDAGRLFSSISNRNRVVKQLKDQQLIRVKQLDGVRMVLLTRDGREYVKEAYPWVTVYDSYSGMPAGRRRRCVIAKTLVNLVLLGVDIGPEGAANSFRPGKAVSEDRMNRLGRMCGLYIAQDCDYFVYTLADAAIHWDDGREMRQMILTEQKRKRRIGMLICMDQAGTIREILENSVLSQKEKRQRTASNNMRFYIPDYFRAGAYLIPMDDMETAKFSLELVCDPTKREALKDTLEDGEDSICLIPLNASRLMGLYYSRLRKTVYVDEAYASCIAALFPGHEVIGIDIPALRGVTDYTSWITEEKDSEDKGIVD